MLLYSKRIRKYKELSHMFACFSCGKKSSHKPKARQMPKGVCPKCGKPLVPNNPHFCSKSRPTFTGENGDTYNTTTGTGLLGGKIGKKPFKTGVKLEQKMNDDNASRTTKSVTSASSGPNPPEKQSYPSTPKNKLDKRREKESKVVQEHYNDETPTQYMVDKDWIAKWVDFVKNNGPPPDELVNENLIQSQRNGKGYEIIGDGQPVNQNMWNIFSSIYPVKYKVEITPTKQMRISEVSTKQRNKHLDSDDSENNITTRREREHSSSKKNIPHNDSPLQPRSSSTFVTLRNSQKHLNQLDKFKSMIKPADTNSEKKYKNTLDQQISRKFQKEIQLHGNQSKNNRSFYGGMADSDDDSSSIDDNIDTEKIINTSLQNNRSSKSQIVPMTENDVIYDFDFMYNYRLYTAGLVNSSFYCYMNASLQCLLCISPMCDYFLTRKYKKINFDPRKANFKACEALRQLYTEIVQQKKKVINPSYIHRLNPRTFSAFSQQDAHEFIRFLLSSVQDETSPKLKKSQTRPENLNEEDSWNWYRKYNKSIVDELFGGQFESKVECEMCNNISTTYDPFMDISVPLQTKFFSKSTVKNCIDLFFQKEQFNLKVGYKCEKCKRKTKATKKLKLSKTPPVVMVHLKRFGSFPKLSKIGGFVEYPEELDLTQYMKDKSQPARYQLLSICIHYGNVSSGHYIAIGKRGNRWYLFNDLKISPISFKEVLRNEAYVLFYVKI